MTNSIEKAERAMKRREVFERLAKKADERMTPVLSEAIDEIASSDAEVAELRQQLSANNPLLDEAADELDRQKAEIESLRQQLTSMTAERDAYMRDYGAEQDRKREVAQQLADSQKREVMLRDGIIYAKQHCWGYEGQRVLSEAMDATADLSGLILCHAEPITLGSGVTLNTTKGYIYCGVGDSFYRAWEPK